jgi:hypothetical protein
VSKLKSIALAALTVALFAVFAGPAAARDRNHDRIPDRWEKRHHLSLKVKQASRDQDRDGLKNRGEFKAGFNPRDEDSDDDGTDDGDENAGTIESFDDSTGVLTIKLFGGGSVSGLVDDSTEIKCPDTAKSSSSGDDEGDGEHGDDNGDDHGDDNDQGDDNDDQGDDNDDQGDDDHHGDCDDHGDDEGSCDTSALTEGREVEEADLKLADGKATFEEIELAQ